ncbi:MAG TPA: S8 family serine peptidase, partial [bacterium]|nr:S8 family serine peptidase [bacterium]
MQSQSGLIQPELLTALAERGASDFVLCFATRADLSPAYTMSWEDRGRFVYDTLKRTAELEQAAVQAVLDAREIRYDSVIAGNEIYVYDGTGELLSTLAEYPEIVHFRLPVAIELDPDELQGNPLTDGARSQSWGLLDMGADAFHHAFGVRGEGVVIAEIGTGTEWDHPALVNAYHCGTDPSDPACWHDPANICGGSMCDNNGYSTSIMGVMVGSDDPGLTHQVGVAPGAEWISCKGCESASCSEASLNSCADWVLAPAGSPSNRPHIVVCPWGGGGGNPWYQAKVQAWVAAGIFPISGAGNSGTCSSLTTPGDYQEVFQVTGHDETRTIATFSSMGPSDFGHDPYTKPNICAPGTDILTTAVGGSWTTMSGANFAMVHGAGAAALLWSLDPSLIGSVYDTFEALQNAADTAPVGSCGEPPDGEGSYSYGYGYLNIMAAGLARDTWSASPATPFEYNRFDGQFVPGPAGEAWANKVYFLGGRTGGSTVSPNIWRFDPETGIYTDTGADMLTAVGNYEANLIMDDGTGRGPALYVIGGYDIATASNIDDVQRYYPQTSLVETVATDPFPGVLSGSIPGAMGNAVVNDIIYVFGGWQSTTPSFDDRTWQYDPNAAAGSRWTMLSAVLSEPRSYIMTAVIGSKIYAMGGDNAYTGSDIIPSDVVEVLDVSAATPAWSALASMPVATGEGQGFSAAYPGVAEYWQTHVMVAGGGDWPDQSAQCMVYDTAN